MQYMFEFSFITSNFLLRSGSRNELIASRKEGEKDMRVKMKTILIYVVVFLTLLGTSSAAGSNNEEGKT